MKNSLEEVLAYRLERYKKSVNIVEQKGREYCGKQQSEGDSLFNYRIHFLLGWDNFEENYPLRRVLEKLQRLNSMLGQKKIGSVKFEEDIDDIHNILDYVGLIRRTRLRDLPTLMGATQALIEKDPYEALMDKGLGGNIDESSMYKICSMCKHKAYQHTPPCEVIVNGLICGCKVQMSKI